MKVKVIYHRADFDGLFSGAVCWHWLTKNGHEVELHGWDFGDPLIHVTEDVGELFIVDLPPTCVIPEASVPVAWIDHHKSSIDAHPEWVRGYQIDGVAACRLAWQWFAQRLFYDMHPETLPALPTKDDYFERRVKEPLALTLAGEYDIWDKRDPDAEAFQFGLTANGPWTPERLARVFFSHDLSETVHPECASFVKDGRAAMRWQQAYAEDVCRQRRYVVEWEGRTFCVLASIHARNSMWFPDQAVPSECDALMCYRIEGDGQVKVSLYHRSGHEEHDLSQIAVKHGGGGHKGACGFSMTLGQAIVEGIVR